MARAATKTKSPPATDAVRREWLRRVEAEYRSAAITQHLTLWLIQIGASPDLVHAARRALDRILRDEVRHRDFGWTLLEWLMEHPLAPALRDLVDRELPSWFARLRKGYAPAPKSVEPAVSVDERAWGLMPISLY